MDEAARLTIADLHFAPADWNGQAYVQIRGKGGRTRQCPKALGKCEAVHELSPGTAVRHFNVMHHMMKKAATIWTKDTGIDRIQPIRLRLNGQTIRGDRYLSEDEPRRLKVALDEGNYRKGTKDFNKDVLSSQDDRASCCHHWLAHVRNLRP